MQQIKANNKPKFDKKSETEVKKIKNGGHVALKKLCLYTGVICLTALALYDKILYEPHESGF